MRHPFHIVVSHDERGRVERDLRSALEQRLTEFVNESTRVDLEIVRRVIVETIMEYEEDGLYPLQTELNAAAIRLVAGPESAAGVPDNAVLFVTGQTVHVETDPHAPTRIVASVLPVGIWRWLGGQVPLTASDAKPAAWMLAP